MISPLKRSYLGLLLSSAVSPTLSQSNGAERERITSKDVKFLVYYGSQEFASIESYDIVVLDAEVELTLVQKLNRKSVSLGYLSLGEVHNTRKWALGLERQGLLLAPNPKWRDARFIDTRDARWEKLILSDLIPTLLARGFAGVFLDTLDDAAYLEGIEPVRFKGMKESAIHLVSAIRAQFPNVPIMVNRGYDILPAIASQINMVLGESVHSTYDSLAEAYVRVSPSDIDWQVNKLKESARINPDLSLFSLDYWAAHDRKGISSLYTEARTNGLIPYVGTFDLTQVVQR
jgi:polysaccharide biosynthesis protein PelA